MIQNLLRSILSDWIEIRQSDITQRWRGQLLSLFLLGSLNTALLLFIVNLVLWIRSGNPSKLTFVYINAAVFFLMCGFWWINRRGWNRMASIAFVVLGSFITYFSVPSGAFENVLITSAIPITLASFLIAPIVSFLVMAVQIALYLASYLRSGSGTEFNYFSAIAMGLLAFITWICAKWFESSLSQSRAFQNRLGMITENMVDAIGHINTHSILLYASPSVQKMFGWEPRELEGRSVLDNIHPDESERILKEVQEAVAQHLSTIRQEFRYRCVDGDYKWVESEMRLMYEPSGQFDSAIFGVRDISRRRQAEDAFNRERSLLRTVIDHLPVAVYAKDRQYRRTLSNRMDEEMRNWNRPRDGSASSSTAGDPRSFHEEDRRVVEEGESILDQEIRLPDSQGRSRTILSSRLPLRGPDQQIVGMVGIRMDITERKNAEEEIRRLNAELERRVEERTGQLEAANREMEAFAYSVSHDLRAPLRSIDGFGQALQEDYAAHLDEQGLDYLQRIRSASQRMGLLIDDLLQLSRLTRGELHRQKLDLTAMAGRILEEFRRGDPDRNVECVVAEKLTADADERLLSAALENLLGNAWKFTSRRKEAKIRFGSLVTPDGEHAFFVKDNGAGFNMDHVDKLFHAFQRLHTVQEFPGDGIGLATVQRIIHRHGGRVWAEGELEKGATFYFTLPI